MSNTVTQIIFTPVREVTEQKEQMKIEFLDEDYGYRYCKEVVENIFNDYKNNKRRVSA